MYLTNNPHIARAWATPPTHPTQPNPRRHRRDCRFCIFASILERHLLEPHVCSLGGAGGRGWMSHHLAAEMRPLTKPCSINTFKATSAPSTL